MPVLPMPDKARVLKDLHHLALVNKGGIPIEKLNRDYRETVSGVNIPFRKFGFSGLEEFLNCDDAKAYFRLSFDRDGSRVVKALVHEENQHIAQMVNEQKPNKKRTAPQRPSGYFRGGRRGVSLPLRFPNRQIGEPERYGEPQQRVGRGIGRPQRSGQSQRPMQPGLRNPAYMTRITLLRDLSTRSSSADQSLTVTYYPEKDSEGRLTSYGVNPREVEMVAPETDHFRKSPISSTGDLKVTFDPSLEGRRTVTYNAEPSANKSKLSNAELNIVLSRVLDFVSKVPNGLWSTRIEVEYSRTYKESLPDEWPRQVENLQNSMGQKLLIFERNLPERCLVKHCTEQANVPSTSNESLSGEQLEPGHLSKYVDERSQQRTLNNSISQNKVDQDGLQTSPPSAWCSTLTQPKLPRLVLPDSDIWEVFVCKIVSSSKVLIRLFGKEYSDSLSSLLEQMKNYYGTNDYQTKLEGDVKLNRVYAAKVDDEWQRVKVFNIDGQLTHCDLIDDGTQEVLLLDQLREIHLKFLNLAAQATTVKLAGLETVNDNERVTKQLEDLAWQKSLFAQVHSRQDGDEVSLILYDTSADFDFNINQALIEILNEDGKGTSFEPDLSTTEENEVHLEEASPSMTSFVNSATSTNVSELSSAPMAEAPSRPSVSHNVAKDSFHPAKLSLLELYTLPEISLPEIGEDFEVLVSFVNSPSDFSVQPMCQLLELDEMQLKMAEFYGVAGNKVRVRTVLKDCYYSAKIGGSKSWFRVKITHQVDQEVFEATTVDYGDTVFVCLANLQPLHPQFQNLPMMAIKAKLEDVLPKSGSNRWSENDINWFVNRTLGRPFIATLKCAQPSTDENGNIDKKIIISLVDTTLEVDADIGDEMVTALESHREY